MNYLLKLKKQNAWLEKVFALVLAFSVAATTFAMPLSVMAAPGDQVEVCHYEGNDAQIELMNENGWINGHSGQHPNDFLIESDEDRAACQDIVVLDPIHGMCGITTNGVPTSGVPTTDLCEAGIATPVVDAEGEFTWSCEGENGGTTAQCSAPELIVSPDPETGTLEIFKYSCPATTTLTRADNGPDAGGDFDVPAGCSPVEDVEFAYYFQEGITDIFDPNMPGLNNGSDVSAFTSAGETNAAGHLTVTGLPTDGRYNVVELKENGTREDDTTVLSMYCSRDLQGAPAGENAHEVTIIDEGETSYCVAYNTLPVPEEPAEDEITIVASKIICEDESELPNLAANGSFSPNFDADWAQEFVDASETCSLASGWEFEWAPDGTSNPGDSLVGYGGGAWNTFGPTNANGVASVTFEIPDGSENAIWIREVLKDGYIPYTFESSGSIVSGSTDPGNDFTAELYCNGVAGNYDNYDEVTSYDLNETAAPLVEGETYYCVAFNVEEESEDPELPICNPEINLIKNPGFENPIVTLGQNWQMFPEGTPGLEWASDWLDGSVLITPLVELQENGLFGAFAANSGSQWTELSGDHDNNGGGSEPASVEISQEIDTIPGEEYEFSFYLSARPGSTSLAENAVTASVDGSPIGTTSTTSPTWGKVTYNFTATGSTTLIALEDAGLNNTYGTLIDDVFVGCIPPEVVDMCENIDGTQAQVPDGYYEDDGQCFPNETEDPTGSIEITKYLCEEGTSVVRSENGVGGTVPVGCVPQSGVAFGYVHGSATDANAPHPELSEAITEGGLTNGSGVLTINNLPATGRYLVVESDGSGNKLPHEDVLGLYCEDDGDVSDNNDNQEITFVPNNGTTHCVAYNVEEDDGGNPGGPDQCTLESFVVVTDETFEVTKDAVTTSAVAAWAHAAWALITDAIWISDTYTVVDPEVASTRTFTQEFYLNGDVATSTLEIAADNGFAVKVNGVEVVNDPDEANYAPTQIFNLATSTFVTGTNTIEIIVDNFALENATPELNPTGVIAKLSFDVCDGGVIIEDEPEEDVDLEIVKTGEYDSVNGQVTFSIDWNVTGTGTIDTLIINDAVPTGTTFVSADNGGVLSAGDVEWNLGSQSVGATGTVSFIVNVDSAVGLNQYAAEFISANQGTQKSGAAVLLDRTNGASALGAPQSTGTAYDTVVAGSFFALGFTDATSTGGSITLKFDHVIYNEAGNDIKVYEITGGTSYPDERVSVEASLDGISWTTLGTITRDGEVDLGSLASAQYVRLTDSSVKALFANDADGYDVDAVEALHLVPELCSIPNTATAEGFIDELLALSVSASTTVVINSDACDTDPGNGGEDEAGITIVKSGSFNSGENTITYEIDWTVTGNDAVGSFVISDDVATGTIITEINNGGATTTETLIEWNLGSQSSGATGTVSFVIELSDEVLDEAGAPEICSVNNTAYGDAIFEDLPLSVQSSINTIVSQTVCDDGGSSIGETPEGDNSGGSSNGRSGGRRSSGGNNNDDDSEGEVLGATTIPGLPNTGNGYGMILDLVLIATLITLAFASRKYLVTTK